jgi:hypothetical protein
MFLTPFDIRFVRLGNGQHDGRRAMSQQQLDALIEHESQVKHSIIIEPCGRYEELAVLRMPR